MTASSDRGGLQPERTSLAWQRTAIAATVIMVPLVVANLRLGFYLTTALGSVGAAAAVVLVVVMARRFSQLGTGQAPLSPFGPMVCVAAVTALAAVIGLATALTLFGG
jgi:uncharacterized membrane protein YidH (DUF202 family)